MLVISTPDRMHCTILPKNYNPYHSKELFKDEFQSLLQSFFSNVSLFEQKMCHTSVITPGVNQRIAEFRHYRGDFRRLIHTKGICGPLFNLAVATDCNAEFALNVSLFEGMEIPTEVEKHLDEVTRSHAELHARLTEKEAHIAWLDQHHKAEVADYQALLAKQDLHFDEQLAEIKLRHSGECAELRARHSGECAELRAQFVKEYATLQEKWESMCAEFLAVERTHSREIESLRRAQFVKEYATLQEKWESMCAEFLAVEPTTPGRSNRSVTSCK